MTYVRIEGPTTETQEIVGIVQANADYFGASMAASENYLVIGAPGTHKIYIYERVLGAWAEVLEVTQTGNHGMSCDLKGDTIAVGGHMFTATHTNQGKVWIYRRVAGVWTLVQEILSPNVATYGYFGKAVALSDDAGVLVIGEPHLSVNRYTYAYHYNSGTGLYAIKTTLGGDVTTMATDMYGRSVAVNGEGTRAVVGGRGYNPGGSTNRGSAWVWDYNAGTDSWSMTERLSASDGATTDYFGTSVALIGNTIAVSAPGHDSAGSNWGAVYVYEYSGGIWSESHKAVPVKRLDNSALYMGGGVGATSSLHEHFKMVFSDATHLLVSSIWDLAPDVQSPGSLRLLTAAPGGWSAGSDQAMITGLQPANNGWCGRCCMFGDKLVVSRVQGGRTAVPGRGTAYEYGTIAEVFGASATPDTTPPTVTIVSPPAGSVIDPFDSIILDVDDETSLQSVIMMAKYLSSALDRPTEVVWDGAAFRYPFTGSLAAVTATGLRFTVRRTLGWQSDPTLQIYAVDTSGNEA